MSPHVVVIGSGFGGLSVVNHLASSPVDITVIDRDNYHGFWPLLYQVATAGLGPDDIARPVRALYSRHSNVTVRLGTVTDVDVSSRTVRIEGEADVTYDYLVVAAGSVASDFGIAGVREHALPLKTLRDAVNVRNHVLSVFERADAARAAGLQHEGALTYVLVGGGPTGVELAGALAELIGRNLASDFRDLDVGAARIVIVEMSDHLLPGFAKASQDGALRALLDRGVEVRLGTELSEVTADGVTFRDGGTLAAAMVVWTAGVTASPLAGALPGEKGRGGTVRVSADLSLPGHPEVFVVGDLAAADDRRGGQLPQLAQVAIQGGRHAARNILRSMEGTQPRPFRYRNHGIMATIGRRSAVAELPGGIRFGGTAGWLAWLAVHLVFLIGFRNRIVVLFNWAWNYLTWDRASRVIIDRAPERAAWPPRGS